MALQSRQRFCSGFLETITGLCGTAYSLAVLFVAKVNEYMIASTLAQRTRLLACALAGAALAGAPAGTQAQEQRAISIRSGSGWLGVNVHIVSSPDRPEEVITLSDVLAGSPAAQAGIGGTLNPNNP